MKYYSPSTRGFYDPAIHGTNMPEDVVALTDQQHAELLEEQSAGKEIHPNEEGFPRAQEKVFTDEELWTILRARRDRLLKDSDWTQMQDSPLLPESKAAWAAYRQELRNVPEQVNAPQTVTWPDAPV